MYVHIYNSMNNFKKDVTALMIALETGDQGIVEKLLRNKADVNQRTTVRFSSTHLSNFLDSCKKV